MYNNNQRKNSISNFKKASITNNDKFFFKNTKKRDNRAKIFYNTFIDKNREKSLASTISSFFKQLLFYAGFLIGVYSEGKLDFKIRKHKTINKFKVLDTIKDIPTEEDRKEYNILLGKYLINPNDSKLESEILDFMNKIEKKAFDPQYQFMYSKTSKIDLDNDIIKRLKFLALYLNNKNKDEILNLLELNQEFKNSLKTINISIKEENLLIKFFQNLKKALILIENSKELEIKDFTTELELKIFINDLADLKYSNDIITDLTNFDIEVNKVYNKYIKLLYDTLSQNQSNIEASMLTEIQKIDIGFDFSIIKTVLFKPIINILSNIKTNNEFIEKFQIKSIFPFYKIDNEPANVSFDMVLEIQNNLIRNCIENIIEYLEIRKRIIKNIKYYKINDLICLEEFLNYGNDTKSIENMCLDTFQINYDYVNKTIEQVLKNDQIGLLESQKLLLALPTFKSKYKYHENYVTINKEKVKNYFIQNQCLEFDKEKYYIYLFTPNEVVNNEIIKEFEIIDMQANINILNSSKKQDYLKENENLYNMFNTIGKEKISIVSKISHIYVGFIILLWYANTINSFNDWHAPFFDIINNQLNGLKEVYSNFQMNQYIKIQIDTLNKKIDTNIRKNKLYEKNEKISIILNENLKKIIQNKEKRLNIENVFEQFIEIFDCYYILLDLIDFNNTVQNLENDLIKYNLFDELIKLAIIDNEITEYWNYEDQITNIIKNKKLEEEKNKKLIIKRIPDYEDDYKNKPKEIVEPIIPKLDIKKNMNKNLLDILTEIEEKEEKKKHIKEIKLEANEEFDKLKNPILNIKETIEKIEKEKISNYIKLLNNPLGIIEISKEDIITLKGEKLTYSLDNIDNLYEKQWRNLLLEEENDDNFIIKKFNENNYEIYNNPNLPPIEFKRKLTREQINNLINTNLIIIKI